MVKGKQTNKQKFKVRQPQRAAKSKRPNAPSDGSKNNGIHTTKQEEYPSRHPTTDTANSSTSKQITSRRLIGVSSTERGDSNSSIGRDRQEDENSAEQTSTYTCVMKLEMEGTMVTHLPEHSQCKGPVPSKMMRSIFMQLVWRLGCLLGMPSTSAKLYSLTAVLPSRASARLASFLAAFTSAMVTKTDIFQSSMR